MSISTIIESATLLAEFIFFLIYCVYLLEMALKDSIVALCPYHSHLPGF